MQLQVCFCALSEAKYPEGAAASVDSRWMMVCAKVPVVYDGGLVLNQLQYTGMLDTLIIRKEGWPARYLTPSTGHTNGTIPTTPDAHCQFQCTHSPCSFSLHPYSMLPAAPPHLNPLPSCPCTPLYTPEAASQL